MAKNKKAAAKKSSKAIVKSQKAKKAVAPKKSVKQSAAKKQNEKASAKVKTAKSAVSKAAKKVSKKASGKTSPKAPQPPAKKMLSGKTKTIAKTNTKTNTKLNTKPNSNAEKKPNAKLEKTVAVAKIDFSEMLTPLDDRLIVQIKKEEKRTPGGLYIPDTVADTSGNLYGKVVSVGRGRRDKKGRIHPMDVQLGDQVVFANFTGNKIQLMGHELIILHEADVLGVVTN